MSEDNNKMKTMSDGQQVRGRHKKLDARNPDWASGLRRLYDSVVEEPLPDSFTKLLDELDSRDNG